MGIKAVTVWQASDGSTHATDTEARAYNAAQVRLQSLRDILSEAGQNIPLTIFNNHTLTTRLRDTCNQILDYNRRYRPSKTVVRTKA